MSQAGNPVTTCRDAGVPKSAESGFSLIEVLAVVVILGFALTALGWMTQPPSARANLRAATAQIAATLRNTRTRAIVQQTDALVLVDVDRRLIWSGGDRRSTQLGRGIRIAVTSAQSQRRNDKIAGIRFYPNGSSSGATIRLYGLGQTNELRVNWLTGRVSQNTLPAR